MSSPKRSRPKGPPVTAEAIQREAIRLFGERSYPVIGMRDLSESVGLLPGSLYAHISSKEDLLFQIVESGIRNYTRAVEPHALSAGPADERLRGAMRAHMTVLAETREHTRVTFQQWQYLGEHNRAKVVALRQEFEDLFMRILQDGIDSGTFRAVPHRKVAVLSIIGALNSATEWFRADGRDTAEKIGEALADNALHGLCGGQVPG